MEPESGFQIQDDAPMHYQAEVTRFMLPFAETLVERSVVRGDAVLDVACGTGVASFIAASVAGPEGSVVGIDINPGMLAQAMSNSARGQGNVTWIEASALELPFPDDHFDSVICQQGVQFFPDPTAGLQEMARVTKPGGPVAVTVWSGVTDSPYLDRLFAMLMEFCGAEHGELAVSANSAQLQDWYVAAGLGHPPVEQVLRTVALPPIAELVPAHMKALPWTKLFFALSDEEQMKAVEFMEDGLSEFRTSDGFDIPFSSYLVSTKI